MARPAWVDDELFPFESRCVALDYPCFGLSALATQNRSEASAVLPRRITASRAFLAGVEAGLPGLAELPALIVWGNADFAFRAKERQRWGQTFPDHRTVIVEGACHFPQSEPGQFAAAIRDWFAGTD